MKVDTKKIGTFLKSIDGAEYRYMQQCMGMRNSLDNLIKRHNLSKEYIIERFNIKPAKYKDFILGNYNYSVRDMACLNTAFMELEAEKLKEEVPFQVAKGEDKKTT